MVPGMREGPPDGPTFHVEQPSSEPAYAVGPGPPRSRPGPSDAVEPPPPAPPATIPDRSVAHFELAQVLTVANQKGGVGKTTTAVSLAAALAELGCRVLLLDLDPQGNATSGVGMQVQPGQPTIYEVLLDGVDIAEAIAPTPVCNLVVVPATIDLAGAEIELVSAFSREQKLRRALQPVRSDFDVILVDCPPSLGLLTVNGLSASGGVLIPIQCEYYALEGLGALRRTADLIRANLNPSLAILGYVMTMLDGRTRLSQQVVDEVRGHFGDLVFQTRIPRTVRLAEAPSYGQPITVFDPTSRGALAYRRLARELLDRLRVTPAVATG
jgi:chromosome partitioning protein